MNSKTAHASECLTTVVIGCFSHVKFFEKTFRSVMEQKSRFPFQVIIYDNGSGPEYKNLIDRLTQGTSVTVIRENKNLYGLGFRINVLPVLKSKYVAFIHDDDCYLPGKLDASVDALETSGSDVVVTNYRYIDAKDNSSSAASLEFTTRPIKKAEKPGSLLADVFLPGGVRLHYSTLVMRTTTAQAISLGDPFYPRIADAFFWKTLLTLPESRVEILERPLTAVRVHESNDRRYDKFGYTARYAELFKLSQSEIEFFRSVLFSSSPEIVHDFVCGLLPAEFSSNDTVDCLVRLSINFSKEKNLISRTMMAAVAFHKAFELNAVQASAQLNELIGRDANAYMGALYSSYFFSVRLLMIGTYTVIIRLIVLLLTQPRHLLGKFKKRILP